MCIRDSYYMLYSANFFGGKTYAVGYATSQSPLGPFTKAANNPGLQKNTEQGGIVTGTGHCMLIDIHNRLYEVDEYHSFVTGGFGASMVDTVCLLYTSVSELQVRSVGWSERWFIK